METRIIKHFEPAEMARCVNTTKEILDGRGKRRLRRKNRMKTPLF